MENYDKLLRNLSPAIRKIQEAQLELIRQKLFGGNEDEYGQRVFNEKLIKSLESSKPKDITYYDSILILIQDTLKENEKCPDLDVVNKFYELIQNLRRELSDRIIAIRDFNYFRNDFLNVTNGSLPARSAIEILSIIESKTLYLILNQDEDAVYIGKNPKQDPDQEWNAIKHLFEEVLNYYILIVFYEVLFCSFQNPEPLTTRTRDILLNLWNELNLILNSCYIHFIYIEPKPVENQIDPEDRITSNRTTRLKIFFSNNKNIFQLRLDISHQGENYFHANLHVASFEGDKFLEDHTFQFSDIENKNNEDDLLIAIFSEVEKSLLSIQLKNRNHTGQNRNEKDSVILELARIQLQKKSIVHYVLNNSKIPTNETEIAIQKIEKYSTFVDADTIELIRNQDSLFLFDILLAIEKSLLERL